MNNRVQVNIRLKEEIRDDMKREAQKLGISLSHYITVLHQLKTFKMEVVKK